MGMQTGTATMENCMEVHQKLKKRVAIWPSKPSFGYLSEIFENIYSQRYMHPYVHCSTNHSGQDMETTIESYDRRLDKEDVVYIYTMEYYSA